MRTLESVRSPNDPSIQICDRQSSLLLSFFLTLYNESVNFLHLCDDRFMGVALQPNRIELSL
jgi:hypothetical protein